VGRTKGRAKGHNWYLGKLRSIGYLKWNWIEKEHFLQQTFLFFFHWTWKLFPSKLQTLKFLSHENYGLHVWSSSQILSIEHKATSIRISSNWVFACVIFQTTIKGTMSTQKHILEPLFLFSVDRSSPPSSSIFIWFFLSICMWMDFSTLSF
jgi:hypothetical protein